MAQEVLRRFICDRCRKPFNETPEQAQTKIDNAKDKKAAPLLYVELHIGPLPPAAPQLVTKFEDLCPSCEKRVVDLVASIRLDKPDKEDKNTPEPKEPTGAAPKESAPDDKGGKKPAEKTTH